MADTFTTYDGSEFTVLRRPTNPRDGLEMRFRFVDRCATPPPHVHPDTRETFAVEEGEFELFVDGDWRPVRAGESLTVEPGTPHTFRNHSGATAVVHNVHDPHHDFEAYLRALAAMTHELKATTPKSPRAALMMARLWGQHPDLIRPSQLPLKIAMPVLGLVARAAGMRGPTP